MKWIIFVLAATFYFYEFFIRVAPGTMVPQLMGAFNVDATAIGTLSGFYFFIYAPMQIPVGSLIDRYGARRLLVFSSFAAGLGSLIFSLAHSFWMAASGRFLMGLGSAFGFVGLIYVASHWFPEKRRGMLIGLGSSMGMLGAVIGEGPLSIGISVFGWRTTIAALACFGFFLGTLIFLFVRNDPPGIAKAHSKSSDAWKNWMLILKNRYSWINAIVALLLYATTGAFAGLWGIPFLMAKYSLSNEVASFTISLIFIGWAIGGPLIGHFSDLIKQRKSVMLAASLLGCALMCLIIYPAHMPPTLLYILFLLLGLVSAAQLLSFSYAIDVNPDYAKGTASAFTNFMASIGVAFLQPLIGITLDHNWIGGMAHGERVYSVSNYMLAMSFFPAFFLLAFFVALFLKRTKNS